MEYNPVLAILKDGSQKVYSNKCFACCDQDVIGYKGTLKDKRF